MDNDLEKFMKENKESFLKLIQSQDSIEKGILAIQLAMENEMANDFDPNKQRVKVSLKYENNNLIVTAVKEDK